MDERWGFEGIATKPHKIMAIGFQSPFERPESFRYRLNRCWRRVIYGDECGYF